jgi:hypothetical protein
MSYQEKLDGAIALIKEHNDVVSPSPDSAIQAEGYIDPKRFEACIKFKARNEDALKGLKYEQILECLPGAFGVKPDSLAKDIAKVFRGKEEEVHQIAGDVPSGNVPFKVVGMKAKDMSWEALIANLPVDDPTSSIYKRLKEAMGNKPFIVFSSGRTVDVPMTVQLFNDIKAGHPAVTLYQGREVFPLGMLPEAYADEDPLYTDRPLRSNGYSDQTNRSWEGVSLIVRQLVRLAVQTGEINVHVDNGSFIANNIMDIATASDAETKLRVRFPKASLEYNKLQPIGKVPILKVDLNKWREKGGSTGPFPEGRKIEWAPAEKYVPRSPRH